MPLIAFEPCFEIFPSTKKLCINFSFLFSVYPVYEILQNKKNRTLKYGSASLIWCHERDSNPQPIAYKAIALPLCYQGILEQMRRVEPPFSAWEADVLTVVRHLHWLWQKDSNLHSHGSEPCGLPNLPIPQYWLERLDSNQQMQDSKSCALPFGYAPIKWWAL